MQRRGLLASNLTFVPSNVPQDPSLLRELLQAAWCTSFPPIPGVVPANRTPGCRCVASAYEGLVREAGNASGGASVVQVLGPFLVGLWFYFAGVTFLGGAGQRGRPPAVRGPGVPVLGPAARRAEPVVRGHVHDARPGPRALRQRRAAARRAGVHPLVHAVVERLHDQAHARRGGGRALRAVLLPGRGRQLAQRGGRGRVPVLPPDHAGRGADHPRRQGLRRPEPAHHVPPDQPAAHPVRPRHPAGRRGPRAGPLGGGQLRRVRGPARPDAAGFSCFGLPSCSGFPVSGLPSCSGFLVFGLPCCSC